MAASLRMTEAEVLAYQKRRGLPVVARIEKRIAKLEPSRIEILFAQQIALLGLPVPVQQYAGAVPGRRYKIDFAWPERKIAVECCGHVHRIKERFLADCERTCLLVLNGWKVLPVSGDDVRSGRAISFLQRLLVEA